MSGWFGECEAKVGLVGRGAGAGRRCSAVRKRREMDRYFGYVLQTEEGGLCARERLGLWRGGHGRLAKGFWWEVVGCDDLKVGGWLVDLDGLVPLPKEA